LKGDAARLRRGEKEKRMSDELWTRSDDWVGTEVDGSYVMVNIESGQYLALNPTAAAIWEALEDKNDAAGIGAYLRARFEVSPEECEAAVGKTLETMRGMALVAPQAA
jgi:hypothetical protein